MEAMSLAHWTSLISPPYPPVFPHAPLLSGGSTPGSISITQLVMLALGLVGLTMVMLSTRRRQQRNRSGSSLSARNVFHDLTQEHEVQRDMESTMVGLDQLARQMQGQLDTKFAKLETLLRDADARIDQLRRLIRSVGGASSVDITLDPVGPDASPAPAGSPEDERYAAIYRLADQGSSALDIARDTEKSTGEVELILALRKTKNRAGEFHESLNPLSHS